jgi:hypothetical protein
MARRRFYIASLLTLGFGCSGDEAEVVRQVGAAGAAGEGAAGAGGEGNAGGAAAGGASGSSATAGAGGAAPMSSVITVDDGGFEVGEAPAESGGGSLPTIVSVRGPVAVTNGGSAVLHVQLSAPLAEPRFIVSLVGDTGFHTVTGVDPDGDGVYDVTVQVSGDASAASLVLRVALTDGAGAVGAYHEVVMEVVQSGQGDVKITLSFDRTHDLDLHVVEPNGEEISYENNASATGGFLDLDSGSNCQPSPANSENIFWPPGGAPSGEYRVTVHNYQHCTAGEIPFTVRIAYDSTVTIHRGSFADGTVGGIVDVATFRR